MSPTTHVPDGTPEKVSLRLCVCLCVCVCVPPCISKTVNSVLFKFGMVDKGHCGMMPIILDFQKIQDGRPGGQSSPENRRFPPYLYDYPWDLYNIWYGGVGS